MSISCMTTSPVAFLFISCLATIQGNTRSFYTISIASREWNEPLARQLVTRIQNVPPFVALDQILASGFVLCVKPSLNGQIDINKIGMLATNPEQLFGNHPLNEANKYVNDLGDEPFAYEAGSSNVTLASSSYLRSQGVPKKTLDVILGVN